jgi:hypothetical protein
MPIDKNLVKSEQHLVDTEEKKMWNIRAIVKVSLDGPKKKQNILLHLLIKI